MQAIAINFIEISRCVRFTEVITASALPPSSLDAKPTAPFMIYQERIMPITPAIAIPPIPIWRP